MNQLDLSGQHAIITGGAVGLGYAIAQRYLASGGSVTLWDRDQKALDAAQKSLGSSTKTVLVNVAEHDSVKDAVTLTVQENPIIHALINSAGVTGPNVKLWEYPTQDWLQVMQVNLNGLFYCCREVVPLMRKHNYVESSILLQWRGKMEILMPVPIAPAKLQ